MNLTYFLTYHIGGFLYGTYFRWRRLGLENMPMEGPALLCSNHQSFIDPPLVGCGLPREIHYLARRTLFRNPVFAAYIRALNAHPVDRDGGGPQGLKAVLDILDQGHPVLVFPEGTRTRDGKIGEAKPGIGLAILKSSAPVLPLRISGAYECYGRHLKFPRPGQVTLSVGKPVPMDDLREELKTADRQRQRTLYAEAADRVMKAISDL